MQITVINLASQEARWRDVDRRFAAVGLKPVRHEAVAGTALSPQQTAQLYSEALNARQYHKPLRAGEIGCYASHQAAWRRLVASGDSAMAVFEDDIEIDDDLPEVLRAVAASPMPWDVLKLIGRPREKILARAPLLPGRELIAYRRVPSLTGGYVVTAWGAMKLLAHRCPFGRPVDVDMRHWWECDLQVAGVHPYPVRGALSSQLSTIGERSTERGVRSRLKRLQLQAHYTWWNWWALRSSVPALRPTRSAVPEPQGS
jgi:glycosyl transferase, family 25